jgi:hypothetical protein
MLATSNANSLSLYISSCLKSKQRRPALQRGDHAFWKTLPCRQYCQWRGAVVGLGRQHQWRRRRIGAGGDDYAEPLGELEDILEVLYRVCLHCRTFDSLVSERREPWLNRSDKSIRDCACATEVETEVLENSMDARAGLEKPCMCILQARFSPRALECLLKQGCDCGDWPCPLPRRCSLARPGATAAATLQPLAGRTSGWTWSESRHAFFQ